MVVKSLKSLLNLFSRTVFAPIFSISTVFLLCIVLPMIFVVSSLDVLSFIYYCLVPAYFIWLLSLGMSDT